MRAVQYIIFSVTVIGSIIFASEERSDNQGQSGSRLMHWDGATLNPRRRRSQHRRSSRRGCYQLRKPPDSPNQRLHEPNTCPTRYETSTRLGIPPNLAGGVRKWYPPARQAAQLCRFYRGFHAAPGPPVGRANHFNYLA